MFVYMIINEVNGKYYVGKHKGDDLRKYFHQTLYLATHPEKSSTSKPHLFNAIRKYGKESFTIHPLRSDFTSEEECLAWEQETIKALCAQDPAVGYNICRGGRGTLGWIPRPETRARMSASQKGKKKPRTPEWEAVRLVAWQQVLEEKDGSFQTPESITKIKSARVKQDESQRLAAWKQWNEKNGAAQRYRAANTHRGTKHKPHIFTPESKARQNEALCRRLNYTLVGQMFGRLTVQSEAEPNKRGLKRWRCLCSCGGIAVTTTTFLRDGTTKSCGCLRRESSRRNLERVNGFRVSSRRENQCQSVPMES